MIRYACVRPDPQDPAYGHVVSTHHTLHRARLRQRKPACRGTVILTYWLPHSIGALVAIREPFVVQDDHRED
jgi:hypothetical protein